MTKLISPPPDDHAGETRLAGAADSDETRLAASGSGPATAGWLSTSGAIDHGRFPPGTVLGNRYRIVGRLGRGGMGEVFRADDLKLGQQVALKFLPPEVDRDPARLTQLHTEVRMARQVSHPNVCRVYDIDEIEGHTFLSMEYVDGEDLASLLRRVGRFPEDRGLEIARQICAGLAAAHERGVVHRDFKPANVMLDGTGRVRITDFGLAGSSGEAIRAGTPAYMAPEQLAGGEVTARSDVYALGLVLYELFTGRRALEAASLAELIRRREQAEVVPPSAIVRELSPEVDAAVMRCLAPDPLARPASALAVAAALPGGDPLAAALAAGETPSPQMVAAAGETTALSTRAGIALLTWIGGGLLLLALLSDRMLLVGRVELEKSADVLEDRAREIARAAGYTDRPEDTARGGGLNVEYLEWLGRSRGPVNPWDAISRGEPPVLRFWYRASPRHMRPAVPNWRPMLTDPPPVLPGMVTVIVDQQGRLLDLLAVPPQHDPDPAAAAPVDWTPLFAAAGLDMARFSPVAPQWTPRVFAAERAAWEGPMPGADEHRLRVEAASYGGKPVAFQTIWPWTQPVRTAAPAERASMRVLSIAGAVLLLGMIVGGIALVRHNLKSGRADSRGAGRIAIVLVAIWAAAWVLGARHTVSLESELDQFLNFLAFALLNVAFTWMFYLALEPFVRRYCPDFLITWSRLLAGRVRDTRVGRDILIGVAGGVFVALAPALAGAAMDIVNAEPLLPRASNMTYFMGVPSALSALLRIVPNALQSAMAATFAYVLLLALAGRRRWVPIGAMAALFVAVVVSEGSGEQLLTSLVFAAVLAFPVMFIFVRYGLVASTAMLAVNMFLNSVPMTANPSARHAGISAFLILLIFGVAVLAFQHSRPRATPTRRSYAQ